MPDGSTGPVHYLQGKRQYLIDITGSVREERFCLAWTYSEHVHRRATIERVAHSYIEVLRTLIADCSQSRLSPNQLGTAPGPSSSERSRHDH